VKPVQNSTSPITALLFKLWRRTFSPRGVRRFQVGAVAGLLVGLIVSGLILLGTLKPFEPALSDWLYRQHTASDKIVIVAVDDAATDSYGWPLERLTLRAFFANVPRFQPRLIVSDVLLTDTGSQADDEFIAPVLARAGRLVQPILGLEATRFPPEDSSFPSFESVLAPSATLRTPNTTLGHMMIYPDPDGVTRRVPLAIDVQGQRIPLLAVLAVALYDQAEPKIQISKTEMIVNDRHVPVDEHGQMLVNFARADSFKVIPFADLLQGKSDPTQLRDKLVLLAPMARAVTENFAVPVSVDTNRYYNAQIQANAIDTILTGKFLREEDRIVLIEVVLVLAIVGGLTLPRMPWIYGAVVTMGYLAAYLLYAYQRADSGIIVTPLYAILTLLLTYLFAVVYRYFSEERSRAYISRMFHGRIAPETISQVTEMYAQGTLSLAGGRHQVTVMTATLREIATLSEGTAPETVIELLDRYSAAITDTVFRMGGSVSSQIGNTVIAVWNFPFKQPNHAEQAVRAAFEIQREIERRHPDDDQVEVGAAIGLATGAVVVGQLSKAQTDYSLVGEVVTLAERITALASPGQVYISPDTREQLGKEWDTRHIHSLRTRGKKEPIFVWAVEEKPKVEE
jgi:adenylate cyclase